MNEDFLPFALPSIGEAEIAEVVDSLRSGWVTTGPKTKRFEREFGEYLEPVGAHDAPALKTIAVNSATAGMHLVLEALGIGQGDEVIVPTFTFTATAEVVRYLGADPVFVDVEPETLNIDPDDIARKITPRTKAIIPVHYGGLACDMDRIHDLARRHGLAVVEDAAHAFPTTYRGRLVGTLESTATVFSFYATKTITCGEGGMIVSRDQDLADRCRLMRLHGISRDAFDRYVGTAPQWKYEVVEPGFKYNLTDIAAALGIQQLRRADELAERRRAIARYYSERLGGLALDLPPQPQGSDSHAWYLYVIRLRDEAGMDRDTFIERMFGAGIGCSVHFIPLHLHPYWRNRYGLTSEAFPHAQRAYERCVSLPVYPRMTDHDVERVAETVTRLIGQ